MKRMRVTTLGTVLLASALPVVGAVLVIVEHPRPVTAASAAPELLLGGLHLDVQILSGRISHAHGKFVLREGRQGRVYILDDQQQAKRFSGRNVEITGTIDSKTKVVHIHKIALS
jgi:valyl-tRNA synthetase